ncbi:LAFA_0E04830g1_1 [Lachancea sp. 'fantastica']|nr:LAFA_0E04830g1_1 [Lachancea sp. 'fantastica']
MLDRLAFETWEELSKFLLQEDRVRLTYVSSRVRSAISPILYRNLFLNEQPCIYSDSKPLLANCWSVLGIKEHKNENADQKLIALIRTLRGSPLLRSKVEIVHCTWHLNVALLRDLLAVLAHDTPKLRQFRNFLTTELIDDLEKIAPQLQSLDLPPPGVLPQEKVAPSYLSQLASLVRCSHFDNITALNIYMDPGAFFNNYAPSAPKLRLRELSLSLRDDKYGAGSFPRARNTYSDIFNVRYLEKLTILSWFETENIDVYEKYHLHELLKFQNLKELSLLSFFANDGFLRACIKSFPLLRRLKLDYMLGHAIDPSTLTLLAQSPAHMSLKYLDLKCLPLEPHLVTIEPGNTARFEINESCVCPACRDVFQNILRKKLFPTHASHLIRGLEDIPNRDIITRIISLSPIIPYTLFVDIRPGQSFVSDPAEGVASTMNKALGENVFAVEDIIKVYHAHLHSLRRTFGYFLQRFPNLEFLNINDVPTSVEEGPGGQKYNQPIYHSNGYENNQVYELVDDENLFA